MQASHANVVGAHDAATHLARNPGSLVCSRRVGGASGEQAHHAARLGRGGASLPRDQHRAAVGRRLDRRAGWLELSPQQIDDLGARRG